MEANQGGDARAAGILQDGEVTERDGVLLCRLGGLVYVWAAPGAAQIEMRALDPAGELAFGPVLGYVETRRVQDDLQIAFQADEFLRQCQDVTRMAQEAPIIDMTPGGEDGPPIDTVPVSGSSYFADGGALMAGLVKFAAENEGNLGIVFGAPSNEWSVSLTWGREAPDSPMAGAQALGAAPSLQEALAQVAGEAQIEALPGPAAPSGGDEDLAEAFVQALARDEYERARVGAAPSLLVPFDDVVVSEGSGDPRAGFIERARSYLGALPRLSAILRQGQAPAAETGGEPDPDDERAELLKATEEKARALLMTFSRNLTAALEGGASFEDAIRVFDQVREEATALLATASDDVEPEPPDIRTARALLVQGQGWVLVKPGTLRFIRRHDGDNGGPAMAVFVPEPGQDLPQGLPFEPGEELVTPMPDVTAMRIPAPSLPEIPEAQTYDSEEGHDDGQPGADPAAAEPQVAEPAPEPATPVEGSEEPPAADPAPEAQPAPVGDRVQTNGGRQGQVVDGPDAEGKVGVQIDGGGVERFGHDELTKIGGEG